MAEDFEDPRKTVLRERSAVAADAAGYTVDSARSVTPYPDDSGLQGGIRADVVASGGDAARVLYFVRVDGTRPLPQWIANHVAASFKIEKVEIYVVVETVGEQLAATCKAAGAGLLVLRSDNTFAKELDYSPPDETASRRQFQGRLKGARQRLDVKLRLNQGRLEDSFNESSAVTATMSGTRRDKYLQDIETALIAWRTWAEDLSARLDGLASGEDSDALDQIELEIDTGPIRDLT